MLRAGLFGVKIHDFLASMSVLAEGIITSVKVPPWCIFTSSSEQQYSDLERAPICAERPRSS